MDRFIIDLSDPYWWVSVVVVGISISVIGQFAVASLRSSTSALRRSTSKLIHWRSKRRSAKNEFDDRMLRARVWLMYSDPRRVTIATGALLLSVLVINVLVLVIVGLLVAVGIFVEDLTANPVAAIILAGVILILLTICSGMISVAVEVVTALRYTERLITRDAEPPPHDFSLDDVREPNMLDDFIPPPASDSDTLDKT